LRLAVVANPREHDAARSLQPRTDRWERKRQPMRLHTARIRRRTVTTRAIGIRHRRRHPPERHPLRTAALWLVALAATLAATSAAAQFTTAPVTSGFAGTPYRYDVAAETTAQSRTTIVAT